MTRLRFSLPHGRRNPNDEMRPPNASGSDFVITHSFVIRHSSFKCEVTPIAVALRQASMNVSFPSGAMD